ncbi:ABC transporter substrate-binding protein, partial [Acinetobacter baumannii]|nr:ABC transporter substrate-binding protein [Acinetobacter baumannii]
MTTLTFQNVKHILAASLLSLGLVACDKGTQSTENAADTRHTTSSL